jgi:hypothetical protein
MKICLLVLFLISCSSIKGKKRFPDKVMKLAKSHVYSMDIGKLKDHLMAKELKSYSKEQYIFQSHPIYGMPYVFHEKNYPAKKKTYYDRVIFKGKDPNSNEFKMNSNHYIELENSEDHYLLMTFKRFVFLKKIGFLKTKVEIVAFPNMIVEARRILYQTGFPMDRKIINIDKTLKIGMRDYQSEIDLIKELEPNIYKKHFD